MKLAQSIHSFMEDIQARMQHPIPLPKPGIYHYLRQLRGGKARVHLRIEVDGFGTLLVNASRIYHFNPTATFMAYLFLQSITTNQAIQSINHYYDVPLSQARRDFNDFIHHMSVLIDPDTACPICDLELEASAPFSHTPSAPYRMDLALTYRCNNACSHCYNQMAQKTSELTTEQWKEILDRLWEINVPHIIFTGGEPTLREDLPELIAYAENKGQITGLNTNGRSLKHKGFIQKLVDSGLDHVQITLESHIPEIHDRMVNHKGAWEDTVSGIKNALASNLYVMTNTTLLRENTPYLQEMIDFLAHIGVPTTGLNTLIYSGHGLSVKNSLAQSELHDLLRRAQSFATSNKQRLIWYTPTQYCQFDPIEANLGVKGCTAALYNMCIEPDGSVLPCQSYYQPLGNILTTSWENIWNHTLAQDLRQRKYAPLSCQTCSLLNTCGSGCPLALSAGAYADPVPINPSFEQLTPCLTSSQYMEKQA